MKVAVVQDWLVVNGGAEKVLKEIIGYFGDADVFALVDFLDDNERKELLGGKRAKTSFIQSLPFAKNKYRNYVALFPAAIESLDLSGYDLIISSSYAVAKGIIKSPNQIHICYCHSPIRYAWDLEDEYLLGMGFFKRNIARLILAYIRAWDLRTLSRVDVFVANSDYIRQRIERLYNRTSIVLYPPVDTGKFIGETVKSDYYFTSARLVPYKRVDLIINAFNQLPHLKLIVSGDGPELENLVSISNDNITFVNFLKQAELISYIKKAKAFLLAANEDFGITSIEAQSCYTPVIALKKGGYLETVIEGKTGIFFEEQTCASLKEAIVKFENEKRIYNPTDFKTNVSRFSKEQFLLGFDQLINDTLGSKIK